MNKKNKNLVFDNNDYIKSSFKNDQNLKIKAPFIEVNNDIIWKTPLCFKSSFEDNKWIGNNYNKSRKDEFINFNIISERWIPLTKKFLCILDQLQDHGKRKVNSYGTFAQNFSILSYFFNEIDKLGISNLNNLKEESFNKIYLSHSNGKTKQTNLRNLRTLSKLYKYGPQKYNLLEDGLSFNIMDSHLLLGIVNKSKNISSTDIISENNALLLISTSIDWVIHKKEYLLDLIEISKFHTNYKNKGKGAALTINQAKNLLNSNEIIHNKLKKIRKNIGKDLVLFLGEGHQKPVSGIDNELGDFMKINLILKKFHQIYQAFSYVIFASFTGWRASEIFSINSGYLEKTSSGYYLKSNLIKTTMNKNETVTRPVPEIVAESLLNLELINNSIKGIFHHKKSKETTQYEPLFRYVFGSPIDLKSMNEDINVAWKTISEVDHKFSTHQFRRFFAHFYIRRYKGTSDAVRWNFRHISKDMILHYTKESMNAKQLIESKKEFAKEIANSIVTDNQYTSISVGNDLKKIPTKTLELKAKVLTIEEASKYIDDKIESEFKEIHAMEWGYCMFQKGNTGAACEAKIGPIDSRSEPSTCGRCKFLVTGTENLIFWQNTVILHQDIENNSFTTKIMKDESKKIIAVGKSILKRHENKE